ncbi:methyltransferase type 12 [gamma proteobacterium NOR5-3]|nr:methyltransferase type 12 [gamma proteobacterium NOR5-3]
MDDRNVPPAYDEVGKHDVFPRANHDERARFNFLANLNGYLASQVLPGVATAYEARAKDRFARDNGREPQTRKDVRSCMEADGYYQAWSSIRRNTMEMRQQAGRSLVLRQVDDINTRARALNEGDANLKLDDSIAIPPYVSAVDIHCMPGCYYTEIGPGDVSVGANYDCGLFVTTGGMLGRYNDGGGQALANWLKEQYEAGFKPKRILDIGSTVGHNIVPVAQAFPDTEIIAVDVAAPVLRYAHARAKSLGVTNIQFHQANAESLDFEDGSFDLIITCMFLHETSSKALPKILSETHRLLADGGRVLHIEQPQYEDDMPIFEQFMRDWDTYNNNEPFWGAMHDMDMFQQMAKVGFDREKMSSIGLAAVVDESIFPSAANDDTEDYGRKPAWHVYVAAK